MPKLTTLEKAKRFAKSLNRKARRTRMAAHIYYVKQNHAYRALLKREADFYENEGCREPCECLTTCRMADGMKHALKLFDAVHGRKTDET